MKNALNLLKKSFIGIPVAIFLYELFNLTISMILNQYVKIDGFDLNQLITDYAVWSIIGYGSAFIGYYGKYIIKGVSKNEVQKSKNLVNVWGFVIIAMILIISIIENDILFGLIVIAMISLLVCLLLFIIFLLDKKEVNSINKKIKENKENKD